MKKIPHKTITRADFTYEWIPNIYGPEPDRKLNRCLNDKSFHEKEMIQIEDMFHKGEL